MKASNAVVLVGSAKTIGASTSESLARHIAARLDARGVASRVMMVTRSASAKPAELLTAVADAELFILATPLYVDSLPYLVIRTLESLERMRGGSSSARRCAFAAIVNCGFPEASQCDTAIAIARLFAKRARFEWAGGLALGQGGAIDGKRLDALGGLTRHVRAALDRAAAALADGCAVPEDAIAEMARPLVPPRIYTLAGNFGWRRQASRNHVRRELGARPYEP